MAMSPKLLRPRQTGFDPRSIAGLVGWWDFSDTTTLRQTTAGATAVTADGDVVGYAADKSGNNRNMTASADSRRPVYKPSLLKGRGGVRFDGTDDALGATTHSGTASETQTWFVVLANIATTDQRRIFGRDGNARLFVNSGLSPTQVDYWSRTSATNGNILMGNAIYSLTYTSTAACIVRQNGATAITVNTPNAAYRTTTTFFIGSSATTGSGGTACDCLEALIWHVALTDSQRRSVDRYLASKYGLTVS